MYDNRFNHLLRYKAEPFFVIRTPLLSWGAFHQKVDRLQAGRQYAQSSGLSEAIRMDKDNLRRVVQEYLSQNVVREAIYVASESLHESISAWQTNPSAGRGQKIEISLMKYLLRMAYRATPFGLFAGHSMGYCGRDTTLQLSGMRDYRRHTRMDMHLLTELCDILGRRSEIRQCLLYYPNSTVYQAADRYRYVETRTTSLGRSHHLVAVHEDQYLTAVLEVATRGARISDIVEQLLILDSNLSWGEGSEYVNELIDAQILVSGLEPNITGDEPVQTLIRMMERVEPMREISEQITQICELIATLDHNRVGESTSKYAEIAQILSALPTSQVKLSHSLQVDMVKPVKECTMGSAIRKELSRGVELLACFADRGAPDRLAPFREALYRRYENQEVPLLEVLDEEVGIGFERSFSPAADASGLLQGLSFFDVAPSNQIYWHWYDAYILSEFVKTMRANEEVMVLEPERIRSLSGPIPDDLPDAFSVTGSIIAASDNALHVGDWQVLLRHISGPSGANLVGRFCHMDTAVYRLVKQHLQHEEQLRGDAIYAEIVHLPEGRTGNILLRPHVRSHDIAFLGKSGYDDDRVIPLSDLCVSLVGEPRSGYLLLRSKTKNSEVIPRLTSAHNIVHPRNLGIYKFLAALQLQGPAGARRWHGLSWRWGVLQNEPFLPRVTCGRVILCRKRWLLRLEELQSIRDAALETLFRKIQLLRHLRGLPRWVCFGEGDHEIPIDLENILCLEILQQMTRHHSKAVLWEMLPDHEQLCAYGPEGSFSHEFILPFIRQEAAKSTERRSKVVVEPVAANSRTFVPGSGWLFAKLYTGTATSDRVLCELVQPIVDQIRHHAGFKRWYFVRYADPDWHLRVRFEGDPAYLQGTVVSAIRDCAEPLLERGYLTRLKYDTYDREIERYGGEQGACLHEHISNIDSDAVLTLLSRLLDGEDADVRWQLALVGVDMLLDDMGFVLSEKATLIESCRSDYGHEFRADSTELKNELGRKYRQYKRTLETLMSHQIPLQSAWSVGHAILKQRSVRQRPVFQELLCLIEQGIVVRSATELARSYIHMHTNRMLRSAIRAHEWVIYDFLRRLYRMQQAIQ